MSVDTIFTRHLLALVHKDVRHAFPEITAPMRAAATFHQYRDSWSVHIVTKGRDTFVWDGRAFDAYEARFKAWHAFIDKHQAASLFAICRDAPVIVDGGELSLTTWGQFVDDNADGIEAGDVDPATIATALLKRPGCTYHGGGGATAQWTIRLLVGEDADIAAAVSAHGMQIETIGDMTGWRLDAGARHVIIMCGTGRAFDDPTCDGWSSCEYDNASGNEIRGACSMTLADALENVAAFKRESDQ